MASRSLPSDAALFIVITPSAPSIEPSRKAIRSHVMRGKNRKKPPPRPAPWINKDDAGTRPAHFSNPALSIAPRVGGDFSFTAAPVDLGPQFLTMLWKLRSITPVLDFGPNSDQDISSYLAPVLNDPACFHFTFFVSTSCLGLIQGHTNDNVRALTHYVKALTILQQRLAKGHLVSSTSDSTILVIVGMTITAIALGDLETAQKHANGLCRMITLRGGIAAFGSNRRLQSKILRADVSVALSTGNRALIVAEDLTPRRGYLSPSHEIHSRKQASGLIYFYRGLDVRLRSIWDDLDEYCRSVNIATRCGLDIDEEVYEDLMLSVHYRLLHLRYTLGTNNALIQLGLTTFASSIFLQGRGRHVNYKFLHDQLKKQLRSHDIGTNKIPFSMLLWSYTIYATLLSGEDDRYWLHPVVAELLRKQGLTSWDEIKALLKSVLWVDGPNDMASRQIAESILFLV